MGFLFVVTAIGYTIVILREERKFFPAQPAANAAIDQAATAANHLPAPEHSLLGLMRERGMTILLIEVAAIGVLTFGAIGLDRIRDIRAARKADSPAESP